MKKPELLRTIETLFWENSFSDLSMDQIATHLGMKKASLYYHFPSKEAMFVAVLEQSYETYRGFLDRALHEEDVSVMITSLIRYSLTEHNLFAIVSQKGYCQIEEIHDFVRARAGDLFAMTETICRGRFGWSSERTFLFLSLTDALAKRCSLERCEDARMGVMVAEIKNLFF